MPANEEDPSGTPHGPRAASLRRISNLLKAIRADGSLPEPVRQHEVWDGGPLAHPG